MKNKALVVCCESEIDITKFSDTHYLVGVERGCLDIIKKKRKIDLAVSDFDSVTKDELKLIESNSSKLIKLDCEKDNIDGIEAMDFTTEILGVSDITAIIKPTKRIDFNLSVIELINKYNVKIINDFSILFKLKKGITELNYLQYESFTYVSLFPLEKTNITIKNMKYNVENLIIDKLSTRAYSNEMLYNVNPILEIDNDLIIIFTK
ncbi:thiamine pyrophosphokinase [Spiroplasma corruscae]|uniref:Thiamine diphosphokinase n=1 Tax=Spiroplasma corruscae TaxID=216934 RepID=A0A222EN76_9MOLU|nr:thiamine diphosphokinase [Spiroplasma corruscae]ASP27955.1 thiamine pyrophosphokinase [Spiroplasma corruscae]